ncbi:MAG: alpha-glucan family phosphorylase [Patescibacteria group bacterium]
MTDTDYQWFEDFRKTAAFETLHKRPIAYFCAEFAVSDFLQIYSGGLGVLAGDITREASDQKLPMVAVGLYYRKGYFHHDIVDSKVQLRNFPNTSPEKAGFFKVVTADGSPLLIQVPIADHTIQVQAWGLQIGSVTMYLLDSGVSGNSEEDKDITDCLYVPDKSIRFRQEVILVIGGVRLLAALNIYPSVYHLNEGHSALSVFEIAEHEVKKHGNDFLSTLMQARDRLVFTNHTLLPAGNESYSVELIKKELEQFQKEIQFPIENLIKLGMSDVDEFFSMTSLALNMSASVNAVSVLHAEKAAEIWPDHPMEPITNGIYIPKWDSILPHEDIWKQHQNNKDVLLKVIKESTGQSWGVDELLVGWAKRIVAYKRPLALFEDLKRFLETVKNTDRPVKIVMAGKAHQNDLEAVAVLKELDHLISTELKGHVVYISNYNLDLAKLMTTGCDIWLNTPIVGYEACGTSGMKAALNGVLPLATRDGWGSEVNMFGIGWDLASNNVGTSILDELEYNVLPMYYSQDKTEWISHMKNARELIQTQFSSTKMLRKYIEKMYMKSIEVNHET